MAGSKTNNNIHSFNEAKTKINVDKATDHSRQSPNLSWDDSYDNSSSTGGDNWKSSNVSQGSDWTNNQADPNETNTKANISVDANTWGSNFKQSSLPWDLNSSSQLPTQDKAELEGSKETEENSSEEDYYSLVKQSLFWVDVNVAKEDSISIFNQIDKWCVEAPHLQYEENNKKKLNNDNQKKLNVELLNTIYRCCQNSNASDLQKFLRENRGKDLTHVLNLKRGTSGSTLLHVLTSIDDDDHRDCALSSCASEIADQLLAAGANPNIQDSKGKTPLHYAAENGLDQFVGLFTKQKGTDPNIQDYEGKTPLHCCVDSCCADDFGLGSCVGLLLEKKADINIQDKNGKTPLQIAIDKESNLVETLLNENQNKNPKKLYEELKIIQDSINDKYWNGGSLDAGDSEKLKKFLDEHKDNPDLKMILKIFYRAPYADDNDKISGLFREILAGKEKKNENKRKLSEELDKMIKGALVKGDDGWGHYYSLDTEGFEKLKKFLDEHKDDQDLKMIKGAIVEHYDHNWGEYSYSFTEGFEELTKLLDEHDDPDLKTILNVFCNDRTFYIDNYVHHDSVMQFLTEPGAGEKKKEEVPSEEERDEYGLSEGLINRSLRKQHIVKLGEFLSKISEIKSMAELQNCTNEAINSGVMLNLNDYKHNLEFHKENYFLDHVIKRIGEINEKTEWKENSEIARIASNIICDLISCGAKLSNRDSLEIFKKLEKYKDHIPNFLKAHEECMNFNQKFLTLAENAATLGKLNNAKVDNSVFYLEYSGDSEIDVAKITGHMKGLRLADGIIACGKNIIKIGKSEVEIETLNGKRNYTNLTGDITLTFHTSEGELKVRLHNMKENNDIIKVEVQDPEKWEKLKRKNEKVGANCLFGRESVTKAIEDGYFLKGGKSCLSSEEVTRVSQKQLSPNSSEEVTRVSQKQLSPNSSEVTRVSQKQPGPNSSVSELSSVPGVNVHENLCKSRS